MWDLPRGRLRYQVPDQEGASWFRHSGAVVSISESESGGFVAVAFGSHRLALYPTARVASELPVARAVDLEPVLGEPGILRCVVATAPEVYVCNFAGKNGVVVLDMWEEEKEE